MRQKTILFLLFGLLIIPSCQTTNPKNDLLFAQNAFLRTVNSLTILKDAGEFDEGEIAKITALINSGDKILDKWTDTVLEGSTTNLADTFETILTELIAYKTKGEDDE